MDLADFSELCDVAKENPKKEHLLAKAIVKIPDFMILAMEQDRVEDFRIVVDNFGKLMSIWPVRTRLPFDVLMDGRGALVYAFLKKADLFDTWESIMEQYLTRLNGGQE